MHRTPSPQEIAAPIITMPVKITALWADRQAAKEGARLRAIQIVDTRAHDSVPNVLTREDDVSSR